MATLTEMRDERKSVVVKARDLRDRLAAEKREPTEPEEKELSYWVARAERLTGLIDLEDRNQAMEERTHEPHRAPFRPEPDAGGTRYPAPGGERFARFGDLLAATVRHAKGQGTDSRLTHITAEMRALGITETVGSDGGFLVQSDFAQEVYKRAYQTGQVSGRCRKIPIGAQFNGTKIPAVNESSRANGSRWGGVLSYWEGEAQTLTASRPKFRLMDLTLKKLTGLAYATDEMLQDSQLLESMIMESMSEEIGFRTDDGCIRGTGGGQILGILNSPSLITVAAASGSGARLLSADILSIWQRCWAPSRMNAVWFINQDVESQLYSLTLGTATVNQAVYIPPGGLSGAPFATLMGRPVIPIEQCSTMGTVGDIILADMGQYALADKGGIQFASSMHVQFLTDEQVFRFIYRLDGQPFWQLPLTPYQGSNTLSPFVVVATRT